MSNQVFYVPKLQYTTGISMALYLESCYKKIVDHPKRKEIVYDMLEHNPNSLIQLIKLKRKSKESLDKWLFRCWWANGGVSKERLKSNT